MDLPIKLSVERVIRCQMVSFFLEKPDGMATFSSSKRNEVVIVRNHEINPEASAKEGPFGAKNKKLKDISQKV